MTNDAENAAIRNVCRGCYWLNFAVFLRQRYQSRLQETRPGSFADGTGGQSKTLAIWSEMGTLTHIQRAALAFKALPLGYAARVLSRLQINDLTQLIDAVQEIDQSKIESQQCALAGLLNELDERQKAETCEINGPSLFESFPSMSRRINRDDGDKEPETGKAPFCSDSKHSFWKSLSVEKLRELLRGEHPKLIAEALASLEPHRAAEVLQGFESPVRISVVRRLCDIGILNEIDDVHIGRVLLAKIKSQAECRTSEGRNYAARTLRYLGADLQEEITTQLAAESDAGADLNRELLAFEDLADFSDAHMRELLRQANTALWAIALFRADKRVLDRVVECMAPTAAKLLLKEIRETLWVSQADQVRARRALVDLCDTHKLSAA